jgi:hypothetical protein
MTIERPSKLTRSGAAEFDSPGATSEVERLMDAVPPVSCRRVIGRPARGSGVWVTTLATLQCATPRLLDAIAKEAGLQ